MATLSSPQAFELCDGTCGKEEPSKDKKHVTCPPSDTCGKGGCYCQLFKRPKGSDDTVTWDVAHADDKNQIKYRPDNLEYKCFCVKPILEHEITVDSVKYTLRYQLCTPGTCSIDVVDVLDLPKHRELKCTGTCEGECKCTMFRLRVSAPGGGAFKPEDVKWELVAKTDKQVTPDGHYLYRCFCLK